jgi:chromosomal replication initiator protein
MDNHLQALDHRLYSIALERPVQWARRREGPKVTPILPYFIAGAENRFASFVSAADSDTLEIANPLLLVGPSGSGKTAIAIHLAAQLTQSLRAKADSSDLPETAGKELIPAVLYITANDFARRYSESVAADALPSLRREIFDSFVLVIEDLQHFSNKHAAQEELALRLEERFFSNKPTLLTASKLPSAVRGIKQELSSRVIQGLVIPISLPKEQARVQIIRELLIKHAISLSDNEITFLHQQLEANLAVRQIEATVKSIALWCRMHDTKPSEDALRHAIQSAGINKEISLPKITASVATYFKIKRSDLRSNSRKQTLVRARSLAMLIGRRLTTKTMTQIGDYFGGRDHTTVLHALRTTEQRLQDDMTLRHALETIETELVNS